MSGLTYAQMNPMASVALREKCRVNNFTIDLPIRIDCDDYHEFSYLEAFFKKLNKNICVHEIGFDEALNKYIGIAYIGFLSNDKRDELLENITFDRADFANLLSQLEGI